MATDTSGIYLTLPTEYFRNRLGSANHFMIAGTITIHRNNQKYTPVVRITVTDSRYGLKEETSIVSDKLVKSGNQIDNP